jgi:hypothetical protein
MKKLAVALLASLALGSAQAERASRDPLPSWNDGPAKAWTGRNSRSVTVSP